MSVRWRTWCGLLAVAAFAIPICAAAGDNPAHSLANKFAQDEQSAPIDRPRDDLTNRLQQEERLRADEADMLERAKAEAVDRRKADEAEDDKAARDRATRERALIKQTEKLRLAHEKDEADRRAAEAAKTRDAEAKRVAEERAVAEKAEAEKRRLADERAIAERKAAEAETARLAAAAEAQRRAQQEIEKRKVAQQAAEAERKRLAAEKAEAEQQAAVDARRRAEETKQAEAQRRMEADREAEARQLSEKLTRAREQREAAKQLGRGYSALGNPPASASEHGVSEAPTPSAINPPGTSLTTFPQEARPQETRVQETRATLLLVMKPGSRGIRRYEQTADPIVCLGASCYVGGGADVPAASMTRAKALGPGNTLGQRAGACRHSLTCIFRGVETGRGGFDVQAIDLRILRHDRRETVHAEMDRSCSVASGKLACGRPIDAGSYRIWVVPEDVAREAGVNALWAALADGLPSQVANRASR